MDGVNEPPSKDRVILKLDIHQSIVIVKPLCDMLTRLLPKSCESVVVL